MGWKGLVRGGSGKMSKCRLRWRIDDVGCRGWKSIKGRRGGKWWNVEMTGGTWGRSSTYLKLDLFQK